MEWKAGADSSKVLCLTSSGQWHGRAAVDTAVLPGPSLVGEDPDVPWCFPGSSAGKESVCNAGHLGSIIGLGRSPGEGKGYPLQYSGLENSMDCRVREVAELDMTERLFTFHLVHLTH